MQKIIQSQTHSKSQDMQRDYYLNQKKASAKDMAIMMFNTATLR